MGQNILAEITDIKQDTAVAKIQQGAEKEAEILLNPLREFLDANVRCKEIPVELQIGDLVLGEITDTHTELGRLVLDVIPPMRQYRGNLGVMERNDNSSKELSTKTLYSSDNELYSTFRHGLRGLCLRSNVAITLLRRLLRGMKSDRTLDFDKLNDGIDTVAVAFDTVRNVVQKHFSTIESAYEITSFDARDALQNAVTQASILSGTVKDFHAVIECEIPTSPIEVSGSELRWEQVLFQLLLNSLQSMYAFIRNVGKVWVTAERQKDNLEIVIKDTGSGIPRDDFERVFEPFYTTCRKRLGLGLSVARHIIESQFQGSIRLESVRFIGTSFFIVLPLPK